MQIFFSGKPILVRFAGLLQKILRFPILYDPRSGAGPRDKRTSINWNEVCV